MLDHVQLSCPPDAEDRARDFYGGVLGLTELPKPPVLAARGGCWFAGPDFELHLGVEQDFAPALKAHPGIRVVRLGEWAARLTAAGYEATDDDTIPGVRRFHSHDVFGNRLEFLEPDPQAWPLTDGFRVRSATADDVVDLVALLTDDDLGAGRETPGATGYVTAFDAIDRDPNQLLAVVETSDASDAGPVAVGTCQLTFIPGLSRNGATRMQIEAVRIASAYRSRGLGAELMAWALDRARERGATMAQLTTDRSRTDAHRFYERLGFTASHLGMKLRVE